VPQDCGLRARVVERAEVVQAEAGARVRPQERREDEDRGAEHAREREQRIEAAPRAQRVRVAAGEEERVAQEEHQRRGRDGLLGREAERERQEHGRAPEQRARGHERAQEGVERPEVEERPERLGALTEIGHGRRLQGMRGPEQARRERHARARARLEPRSAVREQALDHAEQEQRAGRVHEHVENVVAPRLRAADPAIELERRHHQRTRRVVEPRAQLGIVEYERAREAVRVERHDARDETEGRPRRGAARGGVGAHEGPLSRRA
jgi:hypothetical protein